jgi:VanZ family protein
MRNQLNFLGLFLYCLLIYWLSDQPALPMPMVFSFQDKIQHLIAYFIMAMLAWRSFQSMVGSTRMLALASVVFCSLYGVSDEWHQSFVPGRDVSALDWIADTLGAILAVFLLKKLSKKQLRLWK